MQTDTMQEIRATLEKAKFVTGTNETLKGLQVEKISAVYITKNCPKEVSLPLEKYSGSIKINRLEITNKELGVPCKKPFSISVLGILK